MKSLREYITADVSTAQPMLLSKDIEVRRNGLGIMLGAAMCAGDILKDKKLAKSICADYLLTNLDAAYQERWKYPSKALIQERVVLILKRARDSQAAAALLNDMLSASPEGKDADVLRIHLARIYSAEKAYGDAINSLSRMSNEGDLAGAKKWMGDLRKKQEGVTK